MLKNLAMTMEKLQFFYFLFCRFQKEITSYDDIKAYRFSPPKNVFDEVGKNRENDCFCPAPPCAPQGTFNASACAFGKYNLAIYYFPPVEEQNLNYHKFL